MIRISTAAGTLDPARHMNKQVGGLDTISGRSMTSIIAPVLIDGNQFQVGVNGLTQMHKAVERFDNRHRHRHRQPSQPRLEVDMLAVGTMVDNLLGKEVIAPGRRRHPAGRPARKAQHLEGGHRRS